VRSSVSSGSATARALTRSPISGRYLRCTASRHCSLSCGRVTPSVRRMEL
jgi:hypothetical protein